MWYAWGGWWRVQVWITGEDRRNDGINDLSGQKTVRSMLPKVCVLANDTDSSLRKTYTRQMVLWRRKDFAAEMHKHMNSIILCLLLNNNNASIVNTWISHTYSMVLSHLLAFPFLPVFPLLALIYRGVGTRFGAQPPPPTTPHPTPSLRCCWCMACGNNVSTGLLFCLLYIWQPWVSVGLGSYLIRPNVALKQS